MTVTARTANLIINTKRAQFDSLLRAKYASDEGAKAPERVNFLADIGLLVYPEALRWASERSFRVGTTSNVLYVPENEWLQVLAALDKLYSTVRDADTAWKMANVQPLLITSLMPLGFRGMAQALPAPVNTVAPPQAPNITTGAGAGADPVTGALQTGGNNLDQAMIDSSTPVTTREDNVITLPVASNTDPLDNLRPPAAVTTTGLDPKLKMVGFAAAGLVGAFLLVKLAK